MPSIPGISHLEAIRALEKAGFSVYRQGKHIVMKRGSERLVIPRGNPINPYTMGGIVQAAGLTIDEFKKKLR